MLTNKQEILNSIRAFYKELHASKEQERKRHVQKVLNQRSEEISEITQEEIMSALKDVESIKASGEDELVIESIKEGGPEIIKSLQVLFNKCIEEGIRLTKWNNATIIIIHKKGDVTDLENNKPIRLFSHIYKLFTKTLAKRLTNKIDFFLSQE